jgi:hypothetical protein
MSWCVDTTLMLVATVVCVSNGYHATHFAGASPYAVRNCHASGCRYHVYTGNRRYADGPVAK